MPLALALILAGACENSLPTVPLDFSAHDACSESLPYSVDASASEIQCFIEDYITVASAGMMVEPMLSDVITNQVGDPICCEVCANKGTADGACDAMCNWLACDRARDEHIDIAHDLGPCQSLDCGFDFESCMMFDGTHLQWIDLENEFSGLEDDFYALEADCKAHAVDPARPDGLFTYLEQLDGVPNAGGATAEVTDVVAWCIERTSSPGGTGESASSGSVVEGGASADETGSGTTTGPTPPNDGSDDPGPPKPCGPWATQSMAANPTDNFGAWNEQSEGLWSDGGASEPVEITGGGIEYRVMPCGTGEGQECLRIDRLTVHVVDPDSMLPVDINLLERTEPMPISADGWVDVPAGALRFGARSGAGRSGTLVHAANTTEARVRLDPAEGVVELLDLEASSDDEALGASLSLHGTLWNTQPRPEITVKPGAAWNEVVLVASTFDAEFDPITHRFMVLGQGTWATDTLELALPPGRHAVVLFADDVHGSRGIAATWVEIEGIP